MPADVRTSDRRSPRHRSARLTAALVAAAVALAAPSLTAQGARFAAALGAPAAHAPAAPTTEPIAPAYAESVMIGGWSADGRDEISIRLARFPARGTGTLWLAVSSAGDELHVALEDVELVDRERTAMEGPQATFAVVGSGEARFDCRERGTSHMRCAVEARAPAHRTAHPPVGPGQVEVRVSATFAASHRGETVRPGRLEVFGTVEATLETPRGKRRIRVPGKWHEQTGERPRFAGAFTYLAVTGSGGSLLALRGAGGATGFALPGGPGRPSVAVTGFDVDPPGGPRRRFRVMLEDGREIAGEAEIVRETSVPIEGRRRPGSTVVVTSGIGSMVGNLNDWNPPPD